MLHLWILSAVNLLPQKTKLTNWTSTASFTRSTAATVMRTMWERQKEIFENAWQNTKENPPQWAPICRPRTMRSRQTTSVSSTGKVDGFNVVWRRPSTSPPRTPLSTGTAGDTCYRPSTTPSSLSHMTRVSPVVVWTERHSRQSPFQRWRGQADACRKLR